jgi:hypothetical protein
MAKRLIAGGAWVGLKVNGKLVAMCAGCSYNEDFNVQPANVINELGPVSYDSQGYQCTLNVDLLVARDKQEVITLIPTRSQIKVDGKMPENIVEFVDTGEAENPIVHNAFTGVILNTNAKNIAPNAYVTANLTFSATERTV